MWVAKSYSGALSGVEARTVEVEVGSAKGPPQFSIVGLPDQAVKEAKDRVSAAVLSSGFKSHDTNVTVNLAPADVRKEGPLYDLPIALGLLRATGAVKCENLDHYASVGELALSGEIRRVSGVLPITLEMRRQGVAAILVPRENAAEAALVEGIDVIPVSCLAEAVAFLSGDCAIEPVRSDFGLLTAATGEAEEDFADVRGQENAKRAIEVAVAGGHNLLFVGSPGAGKTMLARRIPTILPPLTREEALEVTRIHSVAGTLKAGTGLVTRRPFRAPHHTVSAVGLLGGGAHPAPGEVSLAHRGVLFLDEFPEFPRNALEVLRQPLEDGSISIARAAAVCSFPSKFMLVAAMNPCPCGFADDPRRRCRCAPAQVLKYRARVSGPLLDRIDIQVQIPPVRPEELTRLPAGESSADIRARVMAAREIQRRRFAGLPGVTCNANMRARDLRDFCRLDESAERRLRSVLEDLELSARAYDRVLKVARTVADLAGREAVTDEDVWEAARYRSLDQNYWS